VRDRADAALSYWRTLLLEAGFPPGCTSFRAVVEETIERPTAAKLRVAGVLTYAMRELAEPTPELREFLTDLTAILAVERDWLYAKEIQP